MLEFLENGWALYGLAAVSILGILAALIGAHGYRKLFRQCRSMPDTRNKFLLQLKVKFENTYRVSGGIQNIRAFLERQVYQSRTFGISLYRWERACGQAAMLCFLAGSVLAAAGFFSGISPEMSALYVAAGLLSSFAPAWFYLLTGVRGKKRQFLVSIEDYFENTVVARLQTGNQENAVLETEEEKEKTDPAAEERKKEIEYLKQSLDRIAAGREREESRRAELKFTPEEEKLIGDIIKEYLS